MQRRSFILGIFAAAAAGGRTLSVTEAVAAPPSLPASETEATAGTSLDALPLEYAQSPGTSPHWHHRDSRYRHHRRYVRRRRVCRMERDRRGRRVQRCRWVWI
ncbi:hypothetical protein ARD30_09035 [Bosea thiooxidans]|uniref:Protamine-2 (Modular protein) n=1 Tax=Bosea thiooxidans TaxID=53254 RepID=A0A0Q3IA33_9HYPH|nr:hypothetical protein [Bosea thiooxidans]KQK31871.1 hypothetical protein ARD30_09035 [Bosea thiooxidans]SKC13062.1 hypothetical protein SAMN05660750_04528 [Bosea thiooxidans]